MRYVKEFDVAVFSSAHWWLKPTAYFLKGEMVGFNPWPKANLTFGELRGLVKHRKSLNSSSHTVNSRSRDEKGIGRREAFRIAIETSFRAIAQHHKGLTIFRTISPNHYMGGSWNSGGTCSQFLEPSNGSELIQNGFVTASYGIQMEAYHRVIIGEGIKSRDLFLLENVTPSFRHRPDAHPGRFRSKESVAHSGLRFGKTPEDCLHWCMPGPIDTWNEFLFELIKRTL